MISKQHKSGWFGAFGNAAGHRCSPLFHLGLDAMSKVAPLLSTVRRIQFR